MVLSVATELRVSIERDGDLLRREVSLGARSWASLRAYAPGDSVTQSWWRSFLRDGVTTGDAVTRPRVTAVDLFSGAGGLTLAAAEAVSAFGRTIQPLAVADLDERALDVYRANNRGADALPGSVWNLVQFEVDPRGPSARFRKSPRLRNSILRDLVGRIDLLVAGPPCQGHSSLNNSTRGDDSRNELYDAAVAIAIALGVRAIVIENVPGVVRDQLQVVATAGALLGEAGYHVQSGTIRADRMGWPQRRERHFLLASLDGLPPSPKELESAFRTPEARCDWLLSLVEVPEGEPEIMSAPPQLSAENQRRAAFLHEQGLFDLPLAERPECHRIETTYRAAYGRIRPDGPVGTLTTGFMTPGRGRFIHPFEPRALTAREGARLQGFPDSYRFVVDARQPTRFELAKWIGDAVPAPLGFAAVLGALAPTAVAEW